MTVAPASAHVKPDTETATGTGVKVCILSFMRMCVHVFARMRACARARACVRACVHACVHAYTCTCTYIVLS